MVFYARESLIVYQIIISKYFALKTVLILTVGLLSQTLLGNPRGAVEQGNRNTSTEAKLCLFFIHSSSRSSLLQD